MISSSWESNRNSTKNSGWLTNGSSDESSAGIQNSASVLPTLEFDISKIPSHFKEVFICLITREVFKDPFGAGDGNSFDHSAITVWLDTSKKSPLTMKVMDNNILKSNITLRKMLTTLAARTPDFFKKINTQEVINMNIEPESSLERHSLQHEPKSFICRERLTA